MAKVFDKNNIIGMSFEDINEYSCDLCNEIFINPLVTQCCRQTYCQNCINQWIDRFNTCPNDRQPLDRNGLSQPPKALINIFNKLKVKCNYHLNGCQKIIEINGLANHVLICEFNPLKECKTCGIIESKNESHNCLDNLKIKINSLTKTNNEFKAEIKKLVKELLNLKNENSINKEWDPSL